MTDKDYLAIAYKEARDRSTDPNTNNGAILVDKNGFVVSWGSNHFPFGVEDLSERWERPAKYSWVEHAERSAIYSAALRGVQTLGTTMYCPWFACADCGRGIIEAGIKEVVGHKLDRPSSKTWDETIKIALTMFDEAGVKYRYYDGKIGVKDILINGSLVEV